MKKLILTFVFMLMSLSAVAEQNSELTVNEIIASFSKVNNVKILAPTIDASVKLYGLEPDKLNYQQLLTLLTQYGFSMVQYDDLHVVTEIKYLRAVSGPVLADGKQYPENQFVTEVFASEKLCMSTLMPAIRPLVPQFAHLAPVGPRAFTITDKYANIQRIKAVVAKIDAQNDFQKQCDKPNKKS